MASKRNGIITLAKQKGDSVAMNKTYTYSKEEIRNLYCLNFLCETEEANIHPYLVPNGLPHGLHMNFLDDSYLNFRNALREEESHQGYIIPPVIKNYFFLLKAYSSLSEQELQVIISSFDLNQPDSLLRLAIIKDCLHRQRCKHFNSASLYYLFSTFSPFREEAEKLQQIEDLFGWMQSKDKTLPLDSLLNEEQKNLAPLFHLNFLGDLGRLPAPIFGILFLDQLDDYISILSFLSKPNEAAVQQIFSRIEGEALSRDHYQEVFYHRYGIGCPVETLDQIGKSFGCTREWTRQIEARSTENFLTELKDSPSSVLTINSYLSYLFKDKTCLELDELYSELQNKKIADFLRFIVTNGISDYDYNNDYLFFYPRGCLEEIIRETLSPLDDIISKKDFSSFSESKKAIIRKYYSLKRDRVWTKKGISFGYIYQRILDRLFPQGIRISAEAVQVINDALASDYGITLGLTKHALEAALRRLDYCDIDRNTKLNRKYCVQLTDELVEEMIDYLLSKTGVTFYSSLFEAFKDKLVPLGVTNFFYLKGLIDCKLPAEIIHKKNYLYNGDSFKTSREAVNAMIDAEKGIMSFQKIRDAFPGVKDYVFLNYIYQRDDIIWLSGLQAFIVAKNLPASDALLEACRKEAEELFTDLRTPVITSRKLFVRMLALHPDLMRTLPQIDSQFAFFSFIAFYFKKDYYYRRPYISKDETLEKTHFSILANYLLSIDEFTHPLVQEYITRMGLHYLNSYLVLMIEMSDDFIQINQDTCVKKSILKLSPESLHHFKERLDYTLSCLGSIDTTNFSGYSAFPNLGIPWNKYLLVGIIRSFFDDDYDIEYTSSYYNETEFIIKKSVH
jgi:hypothetical protein